MDRIEAADVYEWQNEASKTWPTHILCYLRGGGVQKSKNRRPLITVATVFFTVYVFPQERRRSNHHLHKCLPFFQSPSQRRLHCLQVQRRSLVALVLCQLAPAPPVSHMTASKQGLVLFNRRSRCGDFGLHSLLFLRGASGVIAIKA